MKRNPKAAGKIYYRQMREVFLADRDTVPREIKLPGAGGAFPTGLSG